MLKIAVVAVVAGLAAVAGGTAALALREDTPPPKAAIPIEAPKQYNPAPNCGACNLPPVQPCIPAALRGNLDCQQCYIQQCNAAKLFPTPAGWSTLEHRYGYYIQQGPGYVWVPVDFCD